MSRHRKRKSLRNGYVNRVNTLFNLRTLVLLLIAATFVSGLMLLGGWQSGHQGSKTAAIVDQLSLSAPNPEFAREVTELLEESGYVVDYYPGESVTVDLYRNLPKLDYDLLIMRAHAGLSREVAMETGEITGTEYVGLFTGETYSKDKHVDEQRSGLVGWSHTYEGGPLFFAINDRFVREKMKGRFHDTIVVMMGCDGLSTQVTAQAFLDKGAQAFVSWSRPVSAVHTDTATRHLLQNLLSKGISTVDAVEKTAYEVGPDPWFGAELRVLESRG